MKSWIGALVVAAGLQPGSCTFAQLANLMPVPAKAVPKAGGLTIDGAFRIMLEGAVDEEFRAAAAGWIARIAKQTGLPLAPYAAQSSLQAPLIVHCDHPRAPVQRWNEDESYRLDVTSSGARLTAPNPLGAIRGMETFLQLIEKDRQGFAARSALIEDRPRFAWRGLHIDVSRHWIPLDVIRRNLAGMGALKLNVLHWHLTDDQGFRVESKLYPKLAGLGSDGNFYTQDQIRETVRYARELGIRIVPEFDMPGHTASWLAGYPDLASAPGPFHIERTWKFLVPCLDPTREAVYTFLDGFIGEMSRLFPDEYFHIGGDEVNGIEWDANASIQTFKREHGMPDNRALQAYFIKRVQEIVTKYGKRVEGWDEILDPTLPKDIVVQSWRGRKSLADAARLGYRGILSSGYYLDLMRPAASHYSVDPLGGAAAGLTPAQAARILGGEACMWTEYVSAENIESRIWPRAAAVAERLWSPRGVTDVDSMYRRLRIMSGRLEAIGLRHRSNYSTMLRRLAGSDSAAFPALKVLADAVEPVKEYTRTHLQNTTQQTPLNRLVDAAQPESELARDFSRMVNHWNENRGAIRGLLTLWKENAPKLEPAIQNAALRELEPLSRDLSRLGEIGLEALDKRESGNPPSASWVKSQAAFLAEAKRPRAEVTIAIVDAIAKLAGSP